MNGISVHYFKTNKLEKKNEKEKERETLKLNSSNFVENKITTKRSMKS